MVKGKFLEMEENYDCEQLFCNYRYGSKLSNSAERQLLIVLVHVFIETSFFFLAARNELTKLNQNDKTFYYS